MKRNAVIAALFMFTAAFVFSIAAESQVGVFSKEDMFAYTPEWKGERFSDGRPKVPESIIKRMEKVAIEEAWSVLRRYGYNHQFEGGWVVSDDDPVVTGRAVTACYFPKRPDVDKVILEKGKREGRIGATNSWIIDTLVEGDVIVVDIFGKVVNGTFLGDNLANSINTKSGGTGVIVDGGSRDIEGVMEVEGFPVFTRGWDPSFLTDVMLMCINAPVRIGAVAVMPGDIVLGKKEGVIFIPAHLAEEVVDTSEIVRLRDEFGHQRLREGKYTPGQIDAKWNDTIEKDFTAWMKAKGAEFTPSQKKLLESRTW